MAERATCRCCGNEYTVNANGTLRYHIATDPECQDGNDADSRKCRGAGQRPKEERCENCGHAGHGLADSLAEGGTLLDLLDCFGPGINGEKHCRCAQEIREMDTGSEDVAGHICRVCKHPVQLTANYRARSHLDPDGRKCDGGSDWPLAVDGKGNRRDTAPQGDVRPAARPEDLLMDDEPRTAREFDPRDDLAARAHMAGDGRTPEQQAEIDRRMADPLGHALAEIRNAAGPAGTVLDRMTPEQRTAALGFGLGPDGGLGECEHDPVHGGFDENDEDVTVCSKCGLVLQDDPADDLDGLFDTTHEIQTETGPQTHAGEAAGCRLPGCCTHPHGFEYGDDGIGHSGSFCHVCGEEEPEPEPEPWGTPADLLARMPEDVQALYAERPVCWDCGCPAAPLVDRFGPDGSVREIVWGCEANCSNRHAPHQTHLGQPCRPRTAAQTRVGSLTEGLLFVRHTIKPPLNRLVYRVQGGSYGPDGPVSVRAIVVSAGPYGGRTGDLTDLLEEITCTDLDGNPRPTRDPLPDPGTGGTSPSSPGPSPQPETLSAPARTTARPSGRAPTSTPRTSPTVKQPTASPVAGSSKETSSGPSGTASTPTPSAPRPRRSAMPDAFSTPKQAVSESDKYDRYGRYKLLHPDTGKKVAWTRATTFAKSVQDTFALSQWAQRMTLKGASLRPDIVAAVCTLDVKQDKDRVNGLVEDAKKAAGDKVAANLGTAVHSFTEDRDKALVGMPVKAKAIPDKLRPTVDAYEELLRSFGLEPVPGLIEFTTAVKQYEICGTSDRVYRVTRDITFKLNGKTLTLYAGEYVVGDVKTGADLSYGWMEICIQLAIYAQGLNTSGVWDWGTGQWGKPVIPENPEVLLKVRTDVAVVPHLPVDRKQGDPLATLYAIDLDEGWAAAVLCAQVRAVRKKAGSTLATALTVADVADESGVSDNQFAERVTRAENPDRTYDQDPDTGVDLGVMARAVTTRPPTLEEKARAVTTQADASAVWKEAVAARTPKAEVDRLVGIMKKKLESHVEQGA